MKKAILILAMGLLLSGCGTVSNFETESPIGGKVARDTFAAAIGMGISRTQLESKADKRCKTYNPNSTAIITGKEQQGDYEVLNYKCESVAEKKEKNKLEMTSMIDKAKSTCKDLGFTEGTDKFADCSLKLYSQSVELAAKNNQQIVVQGQSSGSNVMTIYDPVRDSNAALKRGQGLINGTCTLGNLSTC